MRPDRFFVAAGLLAGLAFVFVTPPFQVPDEPVHFYRAYALSEGELWGEHGSDAVGGFGAVLPASLEEVGSALRGEVPFRPDRKIRPETMLEALRVPLEVERRAFTDYRNAAQFTFVPYLPQAAAMVVARALGAPTLGLLYAARLVNLLAATALIAIGLRRMPSYSWLMAMLALTPMAIFLRSSVSGDAFSTGVAFLLVGTAARLAWGEAEPAGWRDVALMTACAAALCLSKPVYMPLAFLVLLIPAHRFPAGRRSPALAAVLTITAAAFVLAMATAGAVDVSMRQGAPVDRDGQIRDALADPLRTSWIIAKDYLEHGDRYVAQIVGQLGWLDTNLPKPFLWGYATLLGLLLVIDTRPAVVVRTWQRGLLAVLALVTMALVSASQYATFTPYGADTLEGVQGRYFIPLAPAAAWIVHTRRFATDPARPAQMLRMLPWLSLLSSAFALWLVMQRYYLNS
jgi:uncharacterized membrane protein